MKVYLSNLGCKLNLAETDDLSRQFRVEGHRIVGSLEEADLHVVNTCTVTHAAARDSRKVARRGRRSNPKIKTVLTGCYVVPDPEAAQAETGADLIVTNREKDDLLAKVQTTFPQLAQVSEVEGRLPYAEVETGHSRALVKVEDGCNMTCSFCIIPSVRGPQRSRPLLEIVDEVSELAQRGIGEVVITGVQISSYRWEGRGLFELTQALLEKTEGIRIRLSSIAPWQFDLRLLDLFADPRLCPHFHISLQSGSDAVLEAMRRPYTGGSFRDLLGTIRERVPGVAITTDVIVGFPGETKDQHAESLATIEACAFSRIHAFPYSSRPDTRAATLEFPVSPEEKKGRMAEVLDLGARSKKEYEEAFVGQRLAVLWERQRTGIWSGTSENYLTVNAASGENLQNQVSLVQAEGWTPRGLWGTLASSEASVG